MTTPKSYPSEHYKQFRKAVAFPFRKLELCRHCCFRAGHFQDFRPGFRFSHICHVDRHGHFTLKQLRLPALNELHTNSYTGPRLYSMVPYCTIMDEAGHKITSLGSYFSTHAHFKRNSTTLCWGKGGMS
jgi:hypothetical protein